MTPFRFTFEPGTPVHEQVAFAATRAIVSGQMRPGDPFPSVRALSKACKINPNTAHKVVLQLTNDGLLEVIPGVGTVVAERARATPAQRKRLLGAEVEGLIVEAKRLGLTLQDVTAAVQEHWRLLAHEGD